MKIVKRVVSILVVLAVALVAIAYALPSHYRVERSVDIDAPPSRIYPLVAETAAWKRWSAWNQRDPAMTIVYAGPASGSGAQWRWHSKTEGNGEMTFTSAEVDRRIGYKLFFPDFESTATGTITFDAASPTTTRVTWTNEGELGNNPVMRWMGLSMDRMVGNDFALGLANLKALAMQ
jgi:uncharacterized protein YndB with AHSA1/START domain